MKQGIINRKREGFFCYHGWPSVAKDENGTLYAVCSGYRLGHVCPFGKNLMYISRDDGETWSAPMIVNDTHLDDRDAGVLPLGNGSLLLSWFNLPREYYWAREEELRQRHIKPEAHALMHGMLEAWRRLPENDAVPGSFIRLSPDGGNSWGRAIRVPVTSPHGPTLLSNGDLLYLGKADDGVYLDCADISAYQSADGGETWQLLGSVPIPDGYCAEDFHEPHAVQLPNGRILGAIRVEGGRAEYGLSVFLSASDDGGKTWSVPEPLHVCGAPPHLLVHSSGAVILTYGRRRAPFGQRAKVSYDNGASWGEEIVLNDQGIDGDLGYPSTAELSDGSLLTVYYQKLPGDCDCSVLYTKWNLQDP